MLKRFILAGILAIIATAVHGAGLYPLSNQQQFDANSRVLSGARLYLYDGGTTTPRIAYRDLALTTPHPNPIVADSAGRLPLIYLDDGYYRQRLTTRTGTLIFDQDGIPVLTTSAGGTGTTVDPDSVLKTGDFKVSYNDQPQSGFVRANGRTIGSAASGATERANADTQPLYEHLWSYANISVSGGKGASAAADFAANKALVLPDSAGRGLFGSDDLGAGSASRLSSYIPNSTLMGSVGGNQAWTIQFNNLPVSSPWTGSVSGSGTTALNNQSSSHTHTFSGTTSSDGAHTHQSQDAPNKSSDAQSGSGADLWAGVTTSGTSTDGAHTHTYSGTTSAATFEHNHGFNFSANVSFGSNTGGGQAIDKTPPLLTIMVLIRL